MSGSRFSDELQTREKLEFLLSVTALFGNANDARSAVTALLDLIVPRYADAAALDLFHDDGSFEEVFVAGDEGRKAALLGLREIYRNSGPIANSSWATARDGIPVLAPVVTPAMEETDSISPEHLELKRRTHTRSGARIPMVADGKVVGVLTLVRGEDAKSYDRADLPFYLEIAARAAEVIVRARAQRDLIASEQRYRVLAETLPHAVAITRVDGSVSYLNQQWSAFTGLPTEVGLEGGWAKVIHPDDLQRLASEWSESVRTGQPYTTQYRMRRHDGVYRWMLNRAIPVRDEEGRVLSFIGTATDIDERKRSEDALALIAEATSVLASTLDSRRTLQRLADVAVHHIADWCTVHVYDDRKHLQLAALAHQDPASVVFARELSRRYPVRSGDATATVAETGDALLLKEVTPEMIEAGAQDAEHRRMIEVLALRSAIVVPLGYEKERFGAMTLVVGKGRRPFEEGDLEIAKLLAQRASVAIANARLYERQEHVARTLQASFLPASLPYSPDVSFSAIYASGAAEAEIGGDWYDAFELRDGTLCLSIGDVGGRGLAAAIPMGKLRQAFRVLSAVEREPARLLRIADAAVRREHPEVYVTAFVAVYDPRTRMLRYANAGHPPPLIRSVDAFVRRLDEPSLPLGLEAFDALSTKEEKLENGELLVCFTDGLIEAGKDIAAGVSGVIAALHDPALGIVSYPAELVSRLALPQGAHDDVAILTLRVSGGPTWSFDANDAGASHGARDDFVARFCALGASREAAGTAEVVFGELVGNAARYTPGPIDVGLGRDNDGPVLDVIDRGPGFAWRGELPADPLSESGRGLFLITTLARTLEVRRLDGFGTHVRVGLRTGQR